MVKQKLKFSDKLIAAPGLAFSLTLISLALLTFILSLVPLPAGPIETWYSRAAFPKISRIFGFVADSVPFAWLDLLIIAAILYIGVCIRRRRYAALAAAFAAGYLVFFWSWGLNYHREPLANKLALDPTDTTTDTMAAFSRRVVHELNTLYTGDNRTSYLESRISTEAANRVAHVVERLDGTRWLAARRVKVSILANPWFRAAGIDGVFNPLVHEPVVNGSVLDIERPFVIAHELAHVRGYPDEGDANVVAVLATVLSDNPRLEYSGWLQLWLYVRTPELDALLDSGPRQDVRRIFDRLRSERISWVSDFQFAILDWYLKANSVSEGVRSYSRVVLIAAGTQARWEQFR